MWPQRLLTISAVGLLLLSGFSQQEPPSIWRHLSAGRTIVRSGLPRTDPLTSLGANRPWSDTSWLFDLSAYTAYSAGGIGALALLKFLLLTLLGILLIQPAGASSAVVRASPVPLAALAVSESVNTASLPGIICSAVLSALLIHPARSNRLGLTIAVFVVQALWADVDDLSFLGVMLAGLYGIGSLLDRVWVDRDSPSENAARLEDSNEPRVDRAQGIATVVAVAVGAIASPYGLAGLRSSLLNCTAAYWIGAEGQPLLNQLAPIWSSDNSLAVVVPLSILFITAFVCGLRPAARWQRLLPTVGFGALVAGDMRFVPYAAVWFVHAIQAGLALSEVQKRGVSASADDRGALESNRLANLLRFTLPILIAFAAVPLSYRIVHEFARMIRFGTGDSMIQSRLRWFDSPSIDGTILVLDPAEAGWVEFGSSRLRPFLDDRIELFGSNYATYRRLCRDVVEDRHNAYRLTDGTLGGWRAPHNVLPFRWIASKATDSTANIQLAAGTYWGLAYWDAEVVVFGTRGSPEVQATTRRLADLNDSLAQRPDSGTQARANDDGLRDGAELASLGSQEGILGLAELMLSTDYPQLARALAERVESAALKMRRDQLLNRCEQFRRDSVRYRLQD